MKIFQFSALAFWVVFLASCSKDDDTPDPEKPRGIVGEWMLEEYSYEFTSTVTFGTSQDVTVIKGETVPKDAMLVLKEDKTFSAEGSFTLTQSSTVNGETQTEQLEKGFSGSGIYVVEGDTFIFNATFASTESGLAGEFDIVKNTDTELALQGEETRTGSENGVEVETLRKSHYRFTR